MRCAVLFVVLLAIGRIALAGSALYQPGLSGFTSGGFKKPALDLVQNYGTKSGWFWQSADQGSLAFTSRMSSAEGKALYSAVSGAALADQVASKGVLVSGLRSGIAGGIPVVLATLAATYGMQYINNHWFHQTTNSPFTSSALWDAPVGSGGYCYLGATSLSQLASYIDPAGNWQFANSQDQAGGCVVNINRTTNSYNYGCFFPTPCSGIASANSNQTLATDADWANMQASLGNITDDQLKAMVDAGMTVPVGQKALVIGDFTALSTADLANLQQWGYFTSPNGADFPLDSPYTDPATGQQNQTMVHLDAEPNGQVQVTTYEQALNPDGTVKTDVNGKPVNSQSTDPCKANPDSVACASLGTPDSNGPTKTTATLTLTPGTLNEVGSCPADKSFNFMGHSYSISYAPACNAAQNYIRPLVLIFAAIAAYFIFVGGVRT